MILISTVIQTTANGSDLYERADQRDGPPDGSSGRTLFTVPAGRDAPRPDANVIALRKHTHHDPNDTDEHHQGTSNWHSAVLVFR